MGTSILATAIWALTTLSAAPPAPGDTIPDFALPDRAGRPIRASTLWKDRAVVVYFYPADFTPGCTQEAHAFASRAAAFDSLGVAIVGVSVDPPGSHARFAEHCGVEFPLLSDTTGAVVRSFGAAFDLEQGGHVRTLARRFTYLLGPGGVVWQTWFTVTPLVHADEVLDAARSRLRPPAR